MGQEQDIALQVPCFTVSHKAATYQDVSPGSEGLSEGEDQPVVVGSVSLIPHGQLD